MKKFTIVYSRKRSKVSALEGTPSELKGRVIVGKVIADNWQQALDRWWSSEMALLGEKKAC